MKINLTRRDVLKFGAGAAAGVMLTPAPWKAVDDLAIWTQNWKWIPVPPKGPVSWKQTTCSLCTAACPVKARCIGALPVSMHADARFGESSICALGLTGHHLPWHPARVDRPVHIIRRAGGERRIPVTLEAILAESTNLARSGKGSVAVLDSRPGRSVSHAWRNMLSALPDGVYIAAPNREGVSLAALGGMIGRDASTIGLDLDGARTIVSFGAPMAEGWGTPSTLRRLLNPGEPRLRLVHVDAIQTRTAEIADRWLPARPGSEGALALGIAHVLLAGNLVSKDALARIPDFDAYSAIVEQFTPEAVSRLTGIPADDIVATAREITAYRPAVVVAGENGGASRFDRNTERAILGLNILLGNIGLPGGVAVHDALVAPFEIASVAAVRELDEVPDASIALLVVDATAGDAVVPWSAVQRKLVPGTGRVVALSPFFTGIARNADYVVPTASFLETIQEAPTPFDAARATLAVSAVMLPARATSIDPMTIVRALAVDASPFPATSEEVVRARVTRLAAARKGEVLLADGTTRPVAEFGSPDEIWDALLAGGRWNGEAGSLPVPQLSLTAGTSLRNLPERPRDAGRTLVLLARGSRDVTASAAVSPAMTKIYQESGLRFAADTVVVNPRTARELGAKRGSTVMLETAAGSSLFKLETGQHVMPGVVEASIGPDRTALGGRAKSGEKTVLDILSADTGSRSAAIRVVEG